MKHITLTFCALLFASSCFSQQPLSSLADNGRVKVNDQSYRINRVEGGITVENLSNRFIGVEPTYPNLPYGINPGDLYRGGGEHIMDICGRYLSLTQLKELIRLKEKVLAISLRLDVDGNILEMSFFTENNSVLTVKQLQEIETAIKKEVKPVVAPLAKRYLTDTNFAMIMRLVFFDSLLKAKEK